MAAPPTRKSRPSMHDMELVGLSAAGDRAAFGELVRRHGSSVRALLRRMGADPAAADDAAQDAFLTAFERIAEFRGEGSFAAWVRRIAARLHLKRVRRRVDGLMAADLEAAAELSGPGEREAADRLDLDEALSALSPAERLCVSLCYGAGLTHAEAAESLGAPLGTVKSHVKRGLEKLRTRMGADAGPGPGVPAATREGAAHV